ncbi:MAG: clan AA aspartic protease [Gorillibacterium sp.]|nr:clan AA aspartic protease [Gorillibacterium sp.]
MRIEHRDGLLFTSIIIVYQGQTKQIDNIVIDTGASHTLISQDIVDDIGIRVSLDDDVVASFGIGGKEHAFVKIIDGIQVGDYKFSNISLDFTAIPYTDINGLLGLDILMNAGFVIDLKELIMHL